MNKIEFQQSGPQNTSILHLYVFYIGQDGSWRVFRSRNRSIFCRYFFAKLTMMTCHGRDESCIRAPFLPCQRRHRYLEECVKYFRCKWKSRVIAHCDTAINHLSTSRFTVPRKALNRRHFNNVSRLKSTLKGSPPSSLLDERSVQTK